MGNQCQRRLGEDEMRQILIGLCVLMVVNVCAMITVGIKSFRTSEVDKKLRYTERLVYMLGVNTLMFVVCQLLLAFGGNE